MVSSDFVATTSGELHARIDAAYERFVALAASVPDECPVDTGAWTARDVVAHLVNVVNRYNEFDPTRLAADPRGVDDVNARELVGLTGRSTAELLVDLADEMRAFREKWGPTSGIPLDTPLPFHGGSRIDYQAGMVNLIGEYLIHGLDLARANDVGWEIDERDGALLVSFGTQLLPHYVRQTNTHELLMHLELDDVAPWALSVRGAAGESREPRAGDRPDVVLRGRALPIALLFYARLSVDELESADLKVVGGEHPDWVVLLAELFEAP